jgi:GGDEF domain-containing protein
MSARIVEAVAASPADLGDRLVTITTSAGAACLEPGGDGRDVWTRADEAPYQAALRMTTTVR